MERQEVEIKKIQRLLSDAEGLWKDLARASDVKLGVNQTLTALEDIKTNLTLTEESGNTFVYNYFILIIDLRGYPRSVVFFHVIAALRTIK